MIHARPAGLWTNLWMNTRAVAQAASIAGIVQQPHDIAQDVDKCGMGHPRAPQSLVASATRRRGFRSVSRGG